MFIEQYKQTVAIYLRSFIRKSMVDFQKAGIETLSELIKMFLMGCLSPSINFNVKQHLTLVIESLMICVQST